MEEEQSSLHVEKDILNRMVEPGRIALVIEGPLVGKLVCIVEFIDMNRVLVDGGRGSLSKIKRVSFQLKRLQITKFTVKYFKCQYK